MKNFIIRTITYVALISILVILMIGWRMESDAVTILTAELFPIGWLFLFSLANGADGFNKL